LDNKVIDFMANLFRRRGPR